MTNITVIFSRHAELGKCNSIELYRIFEKLNPDVIFEELPQSSFEERYIHRSYQSLENVAIDSYTRVYKIPHIGVDLENIPSDFFSVEYQHIYRKIERLNDENGFILRNSMDTITRNSRDKGFDYLNSLECQELYDNVRKAIEHGGKNFNNERFNEVLKSWNEVYDKREYKMVENIYSSCKENSFHNAIFTIGAAHSKSLFEKIFQYEQTENVKLSWNCYRDACT